MVEPDKFVAKVIVKPAEALEITSRREKGPESLVFNTTCA
jgi:hypothetical protein